MKKIRIDIPDKGYNVYLGKNNFTKLTDVFKKENIRGNIFLVIDSKVKKLYSKNIQTALQTYPYKVRWLVINSSEKNKSYESIKKIHSRLIKNNYGRDSILVAFGGGIVGDISGFAASTYMRGIKYVQIPTTLLSAVDSSVGGKTGINFEDTKNVIGTFYQPEFVLIDTAFFDSLPREERLCGLGEIIKYCFLIDKNFFSYVEKNVENILANDGKALNEVISESILFKGGVVEADEKESGIRKVLNLGHTFAHALEIEQNHKLKHGQAVIVGITCALYLSHELDLISNNTLKAFLQLPLKFSKMIFLNKYNIKVIYTIMKRDKKNSDNQIKFVLLKDLGEIVTDIPISKQLVESSLSKALLHFDRGR